jgi:hypothetical protein
MEQGSVEADPLFVNWEQSDFKLKPESPARKMGAGVTETPVSPQ